MFALKVFAVDFKDRSIHANYFFYRKVNIHTLGQTIYWKYVARQVLFWTRSYHQVYQASFHCQVQAGRVYYAQKRAYVDQGRYWTIAPEFMVCHYLIRRHANQLTIYVSSLSKLSRLKSVSSPSFFLTVKVLMGREAGGSITRKLLIPTGFYSKTKLLRRTLGHLSAVYCVLFDRSGRYIVTVIEFQRSCWSVFWNLNSRARMTYWLSYGALQTDDCQLHSVELRQRSQISPSIQTTLYWLPDHQTEY